MICLSNERVAIFFRLAATLIAAAARTAAVSPVSAQSVAPTVACVAPPGFARFNGRSSASRNEFLPSTSYDRRYRFVIDLWRGRKLARDVLSEPACVRTPCVAPPYIDRRHQPWRQWRDRSGNARAVRSRVFAANPDLVLWQVGSNSVLLGRPIAPTGSLINEGLRRLKVAGSDVVLIDPQYAPKVIAKHDEHDVDLMVALTSTASREMHIDLFQRFALMRYWHLTKSLPFSAFLSKDELHMNDWSYGCFAKLLAGAIAEAATRATVH